VRTTMTALLAAAGLLWSSALVASARAATPAKTDILLLFDTTGSMGDALSSAAAQVSAMTANIDTRLPDVQYGVAEVRDYPLYDTSSTPGEVYPYKVNLPMTADRGAVNAAIAALKAKGGGDGPEAYGGALSAATDGAGFGWRPGARRLVIMIADNVPHDNDLNEGIPADQQTKSSPWDTKIDPGPDGVVGTADDVDWQTLLDRMATKGVTLMYVLFKGEASYMPYWNIWSGRTGGAAVSAVSDDLGAKIADLASSGASSDQPACANGAPRDADGACDMRRPTGASVACNRGPMPTDPSICTATIGDAGPPPRVSPAGKVNWRVTGKGSLSSKTCTLKPSVYGIGISFCEVTYRPGIGNTTPGGTQIPVVAEYEGSSVHLPTSREHRLVDARIIDPGTGELGPSDDECNATADGLAKPARASLNRGYDDPKKYGKDEGSFAAGWRRTKWCFFSLGNITVNGGMATVKVAGGVGATVAVTGGVGVATIPEGGIGGVAVTASVGATMVKYVAKESIESAGDSLGALVKSQEDPPDPRFKALVKVKRIRTAKIVGKGSARARRNATLIGAWLKSSARVQALSGALGATIDKAGGARKAGNTAWEGRQMRQAIKLSRSLADEFDRMRPLGQRMSALMAKTGAARAKPPAKRLNAVRRQIARKGFTKAQIKVLKEFRVSASVRKALQSDASNRKVKTSEMFKAPIAVLNKKALVDTPAGMARYFRLWAADPQVQLRATLR